MRATSRAVLIVLLAGIVLAGCTTTYPAQVLLDPARFDDGSVRLEWATGMDFFNLKITNLTDAQIDLDLANSAIVSVDGEARPLAAVTQRDAAMIPPKAYIVLGSRQGAVFGTDILGRFNAETEEKYPLPANPNGEDRLFLKSHSGETLRLYLSAIIKGRKALLDVPFKISGASRVQSASGDNGPATTAPAATPPAAKP
jgi:hypothetical protein